MATIFTAKSGGEKGTVYTLEIDDSTGGSNTDIEIQGFQLVYDADEQEDPATSIIASSCNFNIVITSSTQTAINSFIDDLEDADEGRFRVKITDNSSNIFWLGFIITDQISVEDQDWADTLSLFQIRAVDGISRLKDLDYNNSGTAYTGRVLAKEHLFNVLDKIGLDDFYGGTDNYLFTINRWYESDMGAAVTDNAYDKTYIDHEVFISNDDNGNKEFTSCYDVLKQLAQLFLCRFYYSNGVYRLDQVSEYRESTVTRHYYYKDGTKASANTGQDLAVTENSDDIIRLGNVGARFFYFAPAREITLKYTHYNDRNYLAGLTWDAATSAYTFPHVGRQDVRLWVRGTMSHTASFTPSSDFADCIFIFEFNITCTVDGTTYYLKRDYDFTTLGILSYTQPEWTTTNTDRYRWISTTINEYNGVAFLSPVNFETPDFPGSAEFATLTFDVALQGVYTVLSGQAPGLVFPATTFLFHNIIARLNSDDDSALTRTSEFSKTNDDTPNASLALEYETLIGDSPSSVFFTSSSLTIDNGGTEEISTNWAKGTGGGGVKIQQLWLNELLKLRTKSLERYEGQIYGSDYLPHNKLTLTDGREFIMQRITYDSRTEVWSGDWYFVGYADTLTGTLGPVLNVPPVTGGPDPDEPATGGTKIFNPIAGIPALNDPVNQGFPNGGALGAITDEEVVGGSPTTTIPIEATGSDCLIADGDEILVIDPNTGNTYTFTVDGNVSGTDTSITVDSATPTDNLPAGSYVALSVGTLVTNIVNCATKTRYSQTFTSTGSPTLTITENSGNLPSNTAQIEVYYGSQLIFETDDWTVSGSDIVLTWNPESGVKIRVFFWY